MDLEQQLGIKLSVLISGLIGGIVSLTYEERISIQRATLLIISGAATAAYLQPFAEHYLGIPDKFSAGLGFVLGLASMRIIDFVILNAGKFLADKFSIRQTANGESITGGESDAGSKLHNMPSIHRRNHVRSAKRTAREKASKQDKEN